MIVEGADVATRYRLEAQFEQFGHDLRVRTDERYKRATWGRRPEDVQAMQGVMGDVAGKR